MMRFFLVRRRARSRARSPPARRLGGRRDVRTSSAIHGPESHKGASRLGGSETAEELTSSATIPLGKGLETITQVVLSHHSTKDGAGSMRGSLWLAHGRGERAARPMAPHLSKDVSEPEPRRAEARRVPTYTVKFVQITTGMTHRIIHHIMCQWPTRSSC